MNRRYIAGLALVAVLGCGEGGPTRYAVRGTVTWQGEPLKTGSVTFRSEGHFPDWTSGGSVVNGRFLLAGREGLPPWRYRVAVSGVPPGGDPATETLPREHNARSELSVAVKTAEFNDYAFDLD